MNSEKVKEILKKRIENINPWETHVLEYHKGLLDLINELESENERLKTEKAKLDSELDKRDCVDYPCRLIEKEHLKQFAERLKEKVKDYEALTYKNNEVTYHNLEFDIDETLKEFIK